MPHSFSYIILKCPNSAMSLVVAKIKPKHSNRTKRLLFPTNTNHFVGKVFTGSCDYLQAPRVSDEGAVSEASEACRDVSEAGLQETRPHV